MGICRNYQQGVVAQQVLYTKLHYWFCISELRVGTVVLIPMTMIYAVLIKACSNDQNAHSSKKREHISSKTSVLLA